jgi:hypothetical protein
MLLLLTQLLCTAASLHAMEAFQEVYGTVPCSSAPTGKGEPWNWSLETLTRVASCWPAGGIQEKALYMMKVSSWILDPPNRLAKG